MPRTLCLGTFLAVLLACVPALGQQLPQQSFNLDFGAVTLGASATREQLPGIYIAELTVSGPDHGDFAVASGVCAGCYTAADLIGVITPGHDGVKLTITFTPHRIGPESATLAYTLLDPLFPTIPRAQVTFALTGTGVQAQPAPPQLTCPPNQTVTAPAGQSSATVSVGTATASGTGTLAAGVRSDANPLSAPYPIGTTRITWTVTDAANRQAVCTQTITVQPTVSFPSVIIPPSQADPHLNSIGPDHGSLGQGAILSGSGFADVQGSSYVTVGGRQVPTTFWSAGAIGILVNPMAYRQLAAVPLNTSLPVQVVVPNAGKKSNAVGLFLTDMPLAASSATEQPTLTGPGPASACAGTNATLQGTGFGASQGNGLVTLQVQMAGSSGSPATQEFALPVLSWSDEQISVLLSLPAGALPGSDSITVRRDNGKSAAGTLMLGTAGSGGCR